MVRKAQLIPHEDIDDVIFDTTTEETPKTDAEKKTDAIADALSSDQDAFINVSRQQLGGNSPMEFVGRYPADKYDFGQLQAHLQLEFGPGDYRCMLYANGKVRANKLLTIARKIAHKSTPAGDAAGILSTVLERMEVMQNRMLHIVQQQQSGNQTEQDFLNKLLVYKQLFDNGGNNPSPMSQMKQFLELQQLLQSNLPVNAGEDSGFSQLLEKATPLFEAAINNQTQKKPELTGEEKVKKRMDMMLRLGLAQLVKAARNNKAQDFYAEFVLDNIPQQHVQKFIAENNAIENLIKINKEVANYQPWFLLLAEHIKAQLGMASTVSSLYAEDNDGTMSDDVDQNGNGDEGTDLSATDYSGG